MTVVILGLSEHTYDGIGVTSHSKSSACHCSISLKIPLRQEIRQQIMLLYLLHIIENVQWN